MSKTKSAGSTKLGREKEGIVRFGIKRKKLFNQSQRQLKVVNVEL